ncbi:hypothetical protein EPO33_04610 [Patescibacteria group bacterium]|nr:MAG: hypothetical protein EPO33_04610 [Patescibacteria group bacterium]
MDTPSATPPSSSSGSNKKILMIILAVVLGLGLLSLIGGWIAAKAVGFGLKKAFEAGGVKIDERGGAVSFSGKDGETMKIGEDGTFTFTDNEGNTATLKTEEGRLPSNFSRDFPIHGSTTVVSGSVVDAPKGELHTATWTSTAAVAELDAWYKRELPAKGWTISSSIGGTTDQGSIMAFGRGEGDDQEGGQLTIQVDDGRVYVHVLFTVKK